MRSNIRYVRINSRRHVCRRNNRVTRPRPRVFSGHQEDLKWWQTLLLALFVIASLAFCAFLAFAFLMNAAMNYKP